MRVGCILVFLIPRSRWTLDPPTVSGRTWRRRLGWEIEQAHQPAPAATTIKRERSPSDLGIAPGIGVHVSLGVANTNPDETSGKRVKSEEVKTENAEAAESSTSHVGKDKNGDV